MAFFGHEPGDVQLDNWSRRLFAVLKRAACGVAGDGPAPGWRRQFRRLRSVHGQDAVEDGLAYFEAHAGDPGLPEVGSMTRFRAKFGEILRQAQVSAASGETVPARFRGMAERLLGRLTRFPPEIRLVLPAVLERSQAAWDDWSRNLESRAGDGYGGGRAAGFLRRVLDMHAPTFAEQWAEILHDRHGGRRVFTWPTSSLVWSPKDPLFLSLWRRWSAEWCDDPTAFDYLIMEVA